MRALLLVVLSVSLAGCATLRPMTPQDSSTSANDSVFALQHWPAWQAVGRIAVKSGGSGFNASFDWRQRGLDSELIVEGPFGAGRSRLQASPTRIRVESGGVPALEFAPPFDGVAQALLERVGFSVPLQALSFWLRGVPDPELAVTPTDGGGFQQSGWVIQPEQMQAVSVAPGALPRKVTLTQGAARIRVIVDRWAGGGS